MSTKELPVVASGFRLLLSLFDDDVIPVEYDEENDRPLPLFDQEIAGIFEAVSVLECGDDVHTETLEVEIR